MDHETAGGVPLMRALWRLYRFCAAFLSEYGVTLGFEAERGMRVSPDGIRGAVFRAEPGFARTGGYINGTEVRSGGFTVALRTGDSDTASRCAAEALAMRLCAAVREADGERLSFAEDGVLLRGIAPASQPARLRLTPDGAIWETRFVYSAVLRSGGTAGTHGAEDGTAGSD